MNYYGYSDEKKNLKLFKPTLCVAELNINNILMKAFEILYNAI